MRKFFSEKLIWIAAFGYFVDLFDLVLYGVVRVDSLKSLGYSGHEVFSVGATLLNIQMAGMLLGGFIWGMMGDRSGRRKALFGSIFLYSFATFLNAYVHSFTGYAILRFLAGMGLAGELGAAVTLVSEVLPQNIRGLGSAFITAIGFIGAACASYFCQKLSWENAYRLGGVLGATLLLARMSIKESKLYINSREASRKDVGRQYTWGSLKTLFYSKTRMKLFGMALMVGVPIWYVAGILGYFAPELARDLGVQGEVTAGTTIMYSYLGAIIGDVFCGLTSQWMKSRKKAVILFMLIGASTAILHPLFIRGCSTDTFYLVRSFVSFSNGYFAILIAWFAELFGTNLRATATTALTSLIRAAVIPLSLLFQGFRPFIGINESAMVIGVIFFSIALWCAARIPETFHRNLDFLEQL